MAKSKIVYYVNEDKGVVVAKQTIYSISGLNIDSKVVRAKAKCNFTHNDKFDVNVGKQIAKLRLKVKTAQFEAKIMNQLANEASRVAQQYQDKLYTMVDNRNNYIEKYL